MYLFSRHSALFDPARHRQVFSITVPMTLSGMSTPLLGMVDTAVMGHLNAAHYIGAVAVGSLVFSFLFWGFGFLRMAVTGISAQAFGAEQNDLLLGTFVRATLLAFLIGLTLIFVQSQIIQLSLLFIESSENVERGLEQYLDVRILSAPAALINYVLLGWFLGIQRPRYTLYLLLLVNGVNIVLDVLLVVWLDWRIEGVAWASVIAEYVGVFVGLSLVAFFLRQQGLKLEPSRYLKLYQFVNLFQVSGNIFIRTLCLIGSFAFFTLQGAKFGEATLAANAILMNFQTFMAHGLDGFAHAAEALVGKYIGKRNYRAVRESIIVAAFWSIIIALCFCLLYASIGSIIIRLLTTIEEVSQTAYVYLPWAIAAPLISVWGYLFDGIFVGAAWSVAMRNTMLVSTAVFITTWYMSRDMGNHGLWLALMSFMLARGVSMAFVYRVKSRGEWL